MKEASWVDCIQNYSSRQISSDNEKAKSLRETAEGRLSIITKELNEKNADYISEDYY
ncbi:MAG: hypothetical protein QT08_C0022G0024 [archaeon GW2011_AR17]|nr:MAG: hypothetical protein QT08_C0022G0024 [archaeon GW2011_AR17]MBS3154555.1 hypothetical protein [Candidatus Woesearchaeota archaeon]HIH15512.1 hypothetical protein [Nanoarchaeota archaeon]HIH59520.1 hypothetical protein [Nanoarchaeota archaeon]HII14123.1 hypothetical protein [Nanoarchaeota archaeon]